jgi:hypothetical protein
MMNLVGWQCIVEEEAVELERCYVVQVEDEYHV